MGDRGGKKDKSKKESQKKAVSNSKEKAHKAKLAVSGAPPAKKR